jgi:hypothetical protein
MVSEVSSLRPVLRASAALFAATVALAPGVARAEREIAIDVLHADGRRLFHVERTMSARALGFRFVARGVRYSLTLDGLWQTIRLWRGTERLNDIGVDPAGRICARSYDPASRMRLVVTFRPEEERGTSTCASRWSGPRATPGVGGFTGVLVGP